MKKILFIALFIVSNASFSQDLMSFNDCLSLVLKNNLDLKTAINSEQIAKYQYMASYGKLLPSVEAININRNTWSSIKDSNTNLFVDQEFKNYEGNIFATFNLFSGFSAINTIRLTKQEDNINKLNVEKIENRVTIDLAQKFITILYLKEIIIANQEQLKSSDKQLELAILKYNSGTISESEVFKLKTQKATEELDLLSNQNRLEDNFISLKQLMNLPLNKEIGLKKPSLALNKNVELDQDKYEIAKKAVELNPTFEISLLKVKKARTALSISRSGLYPTLTARLQYGSNYNPNNIVNPLDYQLENNVLKGLRFNLTIPIFNQFSTLSKIKTNKLNYKQSKIDTELTQNLLSKEFLKVITDAKTSLKKIETSTIAFEFSQKSYEADVLKFELGKININELSTTKMNYNNSQSDLIQSKYELLFNNALVNFYLGDKFEL